MSPGPRGAVVEGTLGPAAVRLVADTDSTLSFIVPGTVSGTQTLSFTTGSVLRVDGGQVYAPTLQRYLTGPLP